MGLTIASELVSGRTARIGFQTCVIALTACREALQSAVHVARVAQVGAAFCAARAGLAFVDELLRPIAAVVGALR